MIPYSAPIMLSALLLVAGMSLCLMAMLLFIEENVDD